VSVTKLPQGNGLEPEEVLEALLEEINDYDSIVVLGIKKGRPRAVFLSYSDMPGADICLAKVCLDFHLNEIMRGG
jgi:hypothetical protein